MGLTNIELMHLKRLCDELGLDYANIDPNLTYSENRAELYRKAGLSPERVFRKALDVFEEAKTWELRVDEEFKKYLEEHKEEQILWMFEEMFLLLDALEKMDKSSHLKLILQNMELLVRHVIRLHQKLQIDKYRLIVRSV